MEPPSEPVVRAQIERICDSHGFRAAPKLARLLRFLTDKTLEGGDTPLGQRFLAQQVLGAGDDSGGGTSVAIRMQVGRLRRHLEAYYASAGSGDTIRVEVPKRNYRLRFVPWGAAARVTSPRAVERATFEVVEFAAIGLDADRAWLPGMLTRELIVALGPFHGVAVRGPVPRPAADGAAGGADFILVGDVRLDRGTVQLSLRLLDGRTGLQAWATAVALPLAADVPAGSMDVFRSVAAELADETGVIAQAQMRVAAGRSPESLSARDATLAVWRFLMTGGPDDLRSAREVAEAVSRAVPDSPAALTADAMLRLAAYLADPRPQTRCPAEPLLLMERAASLAPGDPWVQVHRGFALWIGRESLGLDAICRGLDGRPGSPSFRGMLGSLMSVTAIDMARGEALLAEAVDHAPQPLYWYCHHLALCGFRRGDLGTMRAALGRIAVRTDPFSLVLRMVLAVAEADAPTARSLSRTVLEVFPAFAVSGEVMMRRLLHDDHVDAVATAIEPLGLGWFE